MLTIRLRDLMMLFESNSLIAYMSVYSRSDGSGEEDFIKRI